jgi:NAD(P)H dehydrogenase (quinone)
MQVELEMLFLEWGITERLYRLTNFERKRFKFNCVYSKIGRMIEIKILIVYHSKRGKTRRMAEEIARGARDAGAEVRVKKVEETKNEDLLWADGIIIGSPTYFGTVCSEIKRFIDNSIEIRGKLEGKIGAAFSSSGHRSGGKETTLLTILEAMLIHGMIVCGTPVKAGGHFGVATHVFDEQAKKECYELGKRVAELARKLEQVKS